MALSSRLNFKDLQRKGIVANRPSLRNRIKFHGFPPGRRTGPNSRTWSETEIAEYVDSCPEDPKPAPPRRSLKRTHPSTDSTMTEE